jgi:hypothetical protein
MNFEWFPWCRIIPEVSGMVLGVSGMVSGIYGIVKGFRRIRRVGILWKLREVSRMTRDI